MEKQIIIINGTGGSGKDTFVELCSKYCQVTNFSAIDKIKEIAKIIGWQGDKSEKSRKFLSDLKKLTIDFNDMPFNCTKEAINNFLASDSEILFIHIREPEEIAKVVNAFNAKTLLIKRVGLENISTNYSDASVDNYDYDYIIENSTLASLENHAQNFIFELENNKSKNH